MSGSFMYPRLINITRPAQPVKAGANGYSGLLVTSETTILSNIPANIQIDRTGHHSAAGLPSDAIGEPTYKVFIGSGNGIAAGQIRGRDIITDDAGWRYQVVAVEWQPLAIQIRAQILEN